MRSREAIEYDGTLDTDKYQSYYREHLDLQMLQLEVLLDIRDLLAQPKPENPWTCPKCGGVGSLPAKPGHYTPTCDRCEGAGRIIPDGI